MLADKRLTTENPPTHMDVMVGGGASDAPSQLSLTPAQKLCDGLYNDCDGIVPDHEVHADRDGVPDCDEEV